MECIDFKEKIIDSLYGESMSDKNLEHHLVGCSSCQKEYSDFLSVRKIFSYLPNLAPKADSLTHLLRFSRAYVSAERNWGWVGSLPLIWFKAREKKLSDFFVNFVNFVGRFSFAPASVFAMMILAVLITFYSSGKVDKVDKKSGESSSFTASSREDSSSLFDLRQVALPQVATSQVEPSTLLEADLPQIQLKLPELEKRWKERRLQMMEADADSLMMRGRRFKAMGRVDMALNDFETIYHFYPEYSYMGDVLMYRAQCYAFQGNIDKALESLKIFTDKYPSKKSLVLPMMNQLESEQNP